MSPSEREFGELLADMRNVGRSIDKLTKRVEDMESALRSAIADKASREWVKGLSDDVDELRARSNRFEGAKLLALGSVGAVLTAVGYFVHG